MEGLTHTTPKSHDLDLGGRSSSFAGCERDFSLKVNNKKRAILFSFGACNRLSWGRRVGFFAKGASLMTFAQRLLRASCCIQCIPGLRESTASRPRLLSAETLLSPAIPLASKPSCQTCIPMLLPEPEETSNAVLKSWG